MRYKQEIVYHSNLPHLHPGKLYKLQHDGKKTQNPYSAKVGHGNDLETQNLCKDYRNKLKSVQKPNKANAGKTSRSRVIAAAALRRQ